jgi:tRNA nucleotidyltransferase (CCA-adding enzyme)
MNSGFRALSSERVFGEFWKWAAYGKYPSKGIQVLRNTGWISCFPEIAAMLATPQDPQWHPEGDVLTHTEHCLDAAVEICERRSFDEKARGIVVLAVLCHDMGKPKTTALNERDRITALKHAPVGGEVAREFLSKMKTPGWLVDTVVPLTVEHMAHVHRANAFPFKSEETIEPTERAVRRLARRVEPASIDQWAAVCEADHSGRPPLPKGNPVQAWEAVAERLAVRQHAPKPILMGRHMIELGIEPGPRMGKMLGQAFERQLDGEFEDIEEAIAWARKRFS